VTKSQGRGGHPPRHSFYDISANYRLSFGNAAAAGVVNLLIVAALFWYRRERNSARGPRGRRGAELVEARSVPELPARHHFDLSRQHRHSQFIKLVQQQVDQASWIQQQ
jgi:hypothetical protein